MRIIFKNEKLFAKIRYNIHHNNTDLKWRLFVKEGGNDEVMFLCKNINTYVSGYTHEEMLNGVGHYSLVYPCSKILIDENLVAWIQ